MTVKLRAGEVTEEEFPVYEAVIECPPAASDELLYVATSLDIVAEPNVVDPSLNVTVPEAFGNSSVAVNCTAPPYTLEFGLADTVRASKVADPAPLRDGVKNTT